MKNKQILLVLLAFTFCQSLYSLDAKWQVTLPVSDVQNWNVAVGADGAVAVIKTAIVYWYSPSGSLQATVDVISEAGEGGAGSGFDDYKVIAVSGSYLLVAQESWDTTQARLIVFTRSSSGTLSNVAIAGSPPDRDDMNLPASNCIPVVNGTTLTVYSSPDLSGISSSAGLSMIPNNAVVIPSSYQGNVEIMLETSDDLVEWTQALPGTYNPATSPRFFRVRAESAE